MAGTLSLIVIVHADQSTGKGTVDDKACELALGTCILEILGDVLVLGIIFRSRHDRGDVAECFVFLRAAPFFDHQLLYHLYGLAQGIPLRGDLVEYGYEDEFRVDGNIGPVHQGVGSDTGFFPHRGEVAGQHSDRPISVCFSHVGGHLRELVLEKVAGLVDRQGRLDGVQG